jgi:hypothetical protein
MPCDNCSQFVNFTFCAGCGDRITPPAIDIVSTLEDKITTKNLFLCIVSKRYEKSHNFIYAPSRSSTVNGQSYCKDVAKLSFPMTDYTIRDALYHLIWSIDYETDFRITVYSSYRAFDELGKTYVLLEQSEDAKNMERRIKLLMKSTENIYIDDEDKLGLRFDDEFELGIGRFIKNIGGKVDDYYGQLKVIDGVKVWKRNCKLANEFQKIDEFMSVIESLVKEANTNGILVSPFQLYSNMMDWKLQ